MNIIFIDGQNLYLGTRDAGWAINHKRFRVYLGEKYNIHEAYYFIGYKTKAEQSLYNNLEKAGFILIFKQHSRDLKGDKKGNVDSDIIFELMRQLIENRLINKTYIVSGDGDYKKLVDYLILKNKFGKILFPNKQFASSLYYILGSEFFDYLEEVDSQSKIRYIK